MSGDVKRHQGREGRISQGIEEMSIDSEDVPVGRRRDGGHSESAEGGWKDRLVM